MNKVIFIFSLFLFLSCGNIDELGNNYYFLSEYDAMDIGYPFGSTIYKSSNKNTYDNILIYSNIIKINYNDSYIIALQKPNEKLIKSRIINDLKFWSNYYLEMKNDSLINVSFGKLRTKYLYNLILKNKSKNLEQIVDSIFNNNLSFKNLFKNEENYFIIQKIKNSIVGPLDINEFLKIKNKKKIELDLE